MPSTAVLMRILVLLFISLIFGGQVAVAQTMVTIDIQENGTAMWTMEKRLPLTTSEVNEWEIIIKKGQNISKYQTEIKAEIDGLLSSVQNFSNRSMEIDKVNISYDTIKTLSGGFGIIRYGFEWKNFSRIDSGKIIIGDAFSEGNILPSDITLIIKIPEGYEVQSIDPDSSKRDGNRLIWDSSMHPIFEKGKPSIVLSRTIINQDTWPVSLIPVIGLAAAGTLFLFWRRTRSSRNSRKDNAALIHGTVINTNQTDTTGQIETTVANAVLEDNTGINAIKTDIAGINTNQVDSTGTNTALTVTTGITTQTDRIGTDTTLSGDTGIKATLLDNAGITQSDNTKSETAFTPLPDLANEILGDEEMIEQYLIKCNGQAYQSDIVEESGLSKSKISIVLAKMKEEGRILKIRKGKENIIRLAPKK